MQRILTSLRRLAGDCAGVAALEFALIAPLMLALLGAAVDLGLAFDRTIRLENVARTGAQYVTRVPGNATGAQAAALSSLNAIAGWGGATVTVSPMVCTCPPAGSGTGGPVVNCTSACATGLARYITVTATRPFTPIFPTSAIIPFNNLGASTAQVVARVQ